MRDYVIYDMYTDDRMFRYEVYKHPNGMSSTSTVTFPKKSHILPTPSKEL